MQLVETAHHNGNDLRRDRSPPPRIWAGRPPSAPPPAAHTGGARTGRPSPDRPGRDGRAGSSPWPLGQEIPFHRQLADLGVKLGLFALARPVALVGHRRPAREKARHVVENQLLPSVDLVGMDPCRLASSAIVASSRIASNAIFAFTTASNFLGVFVMPVLHRSDRARRVTP